MAGLSEDSSLLHQHSFAPSVSNGYLPGNDVEMDAATSQGSQSPRAPAMATRSRSTKLFGNPSAPEPPQTTSQRLVYPEQTSVFDYNATQVAEKILSARGQLYPPGSVRGQNVRESLLSRLKAKISWPLVIVMLLTGTLVAYYQFRDRIRAALFRSYSRTEPWASETLRWDELEAYKWRANQATFWWPPDGEHKKAWVSEVYYRDEGINNFSELGQHVEHLQGIADLFRSQGRNIIWLSGDSQIDNKAFVMVGPDFPVTPWAYPKNGYELDIPFTSNARAGGGRNSRGRTSNQQTAHQPLKIGKVLRDVSYWMSQLLLDVAEFRHLDKPAARIAREKQPEKPEDSYSGLVTINAAVAGSGIQERLLAKDEGADSYLALRAEQHDKFIARNLRSSDVLLVSLGGNDLLGGRRMFMEVLAREETSNQKGLFALVHRIFFTEALEYLEYITNGNDKAKIPRVLVLPTYLYPEQSPKLSLFLFGLAHKVGMSGWGFVERVLDQVQAEHEALKQELLKKEEWKHVKIVTPNVHRTFGGVASAPDVTEIHPTSEGALKLGYGYLTAIRDALKEGSGVENAAAGEAAAAGRV